MWTIRVPTIEGFLWVKCKAGMTGNEYIQVAKFYSSQCNDVVDMVYLEGDNYAVRPSSMSVRCNPANIFEYSDRPIEQPEG